MRSKKIPGRRAVLTIRPERGKKAQFEAIAAGKNLSVSALGEELIDACIKKFNRRQRNGNDKK